MTAPGMPRAGGEHRGNSTDRANRKVWMLFEFGNGEYVLCVHCNTTLTYDTVEADRIVPGGSYARCNVQPACRRCNAARSNNDAWVSPVQIARRSVEDAVYAFAAAWYVLETFTADGGGHDVFLLRVATSR